MGLKCRYNGRSKARIVVKEACIVAICPEQLGGLATPRAPAHFAGGTGIDVIAGRARVVNARGEDVTAAYLRGAREAVAICKRFKIRKAYLKEKSPSCGVKSVTVDGKLTRGMGVAAAMLKKAGVQLVSVP
jgi:uncharacterized protein YbbK (DUF523 family)